MNNRKVYCLYHEKQIITNFCRDKNCLMPLCPTCIRQHTEYHQQIKTKPQYQNLAQTYAQVKQQITSAILQVQQNKKKNSQVFKKIAAWQSSLKDILQNAKELIHGWIDEHFAQLQRQITNNYHLVHQQTGVFSINKTQQLQSQLNHNLNQLSQLYQSLKTQKFIGNIILFLEQKNQKFISTHKKYNSFHQANQKYMPHIEMQSNFKDLFFNCLARMFKIQRSLQKQNNRNEEKSSRSKSPRFANSNKYHKIDEKKEKIERSYTPQRSIVFMRNKEQHSLLGLVPNKNTLYTSRPYNIKPLQSSFVQLNQKNSYINQSANRKQKNKLQNSIYKGFYK